ncbi:peptidylprolyl isomerase [Fulvivirga lutimaris]|uniref:peptidylprolyl isomerase n=1 Tax=Fulvivirga lutimaris TaxID=1819566 RepID=UPI0012BD33E2|nr:peptidylprolyl isomerase [Fulvivirga lutimaris]MTI39873.1 peptidylprolyl isomerase [Fulvivirga lutimaris]
MIKANQLIFKKVAIVLLFSIFYSCATDKDYLVTIKTEYGDMHAILYDETPKHKDNFIKLAQEGFYDSTLFHRVMKEFMVQGGDPNSKGIAPGARLGNGGPGYNVPAEFNKKYYHEKGALAAARQPDQVNPERESSGSQFYIVQGKVWTEEELTVDMQALGRACQQMLQQPRFDSLRTVLINTYQTEGPEAYGKKLVSLKDMVEKEMQVNVTKDMAPERLKAYTTIGGAPHLDDEYTVFGKVIDGLEVVDKIADNEVDRANRPLEDIIVTMSVEELPKKKITKLYGYEYPEEEK